MGSEFFRQPAKRLDREFRSMGASRVESTSRNVVYRFPDGARVLVPTNIAPGNARAMLNDMQRRYGAPDRDPLGHTERRHGAPDIDLNRLTASKHAMERFDLMRNQAGLTYQEMVMALRVPQRVLWSLVHERWLWVGDRIAVAAEVSDRGEAVICTVLWTSRELWAQNPRPEQVLR